MSYEDYLLWSTEDKHAEWVNGEVIIHMPPTDLHQALLGFVYTFLAPLCRDGAARTTRKSRRSR